MVAFGVLVVAILGFGLNANFVVWAGFGFLICWGLRMVFG